MKKGKYVFELERYEGDINTVGDLKELLKGYDIKIVKVEVPFGLPEVTVLTTRQELEKFFINVFMWDEWDYIEELNSIRYEGGEPRVLYTFILERFEGDVDTEEDLAELIKGCDITIRNVKEVDGKVTEIEVETTLTELEEFFLNAFVWDVYSYYPELESVEYI